MFKPFSLLFFIAVFAWIISIFLTTDGAKRVERTCSPVGMAGKMAVSATALVADQFTGNVQTAVNQAVYGCRYMVWRSAYEDDYLKYLSGVQEQNTDSGQQEMSQPAGATPGTVGLSTARTGHQLTPKKEKL